MRLKYLLFCFVLLLSGSANAQNYLQQYFDGADTGITALKIIRDTAASNIWQVGKPQKIIFNAAATLPNAIVTDTIHAYPPNNISRWGFTLKNANLPQYAILSLRWKQKLDMVRKHAGGIIEYSINNGLIWENAFDLNSSSFISNFYGFSPLNRDTLNSGERAFSGTDTAWKDIWLCLYLSQTPRPDSVMFRFTLKSDTLTGNKEGWMIDNFRVQPTFFHTIGKAPDTSPFLKIYPTETTGLIMIEASQKQQINGVKGIELYDASGKMTERWGGSGGKTSIDISQHQPGNYFLKVHTDLRTQTFKIILLNQ